MLPHPVAALLCSERVRSENRALLTAGVATASVLLFKRRCAIDRLFACPCAYLLLTLPVPRMLRPRSVCSRRPCRLHDKAAGEFDMLRIATDMFDLAAKVRAALL